MAPIGLLEFPTYRNFSTQNLDLGLLRLKFPSSLVLVLECLMDFFPPSLDPWTPGVYEVPSVGVHTEKL